MLKNIINIYSLIVKIFSIYDPLSKYKKNQFNVNKLTLRSNCYRLV